MIHAALGFFFSRFSSCCILSSLLFVVQFIRSVNQVCMHRAAIELVSAERRLLPPSAPLTAWLLGQGSPAPTKECCQTYRCSSRLPLLRAPVLVLASILIQSPANHDSNVVQRSARDRTSCELLDRALRHARTAPARYGDPLPGLCRGARVRCQDRSRRVSQVTTLLEVDLAGLITLRA